MTNVPGSGASVHQAEILLFHVLLQLIVIIAAARSAGGVARWLGQPRAVGEIIAGLILGPSLLGHLLPDISATVFHSVPPEPMNILSQIGLILLMFQIGMDFDFSHLRERRNRAAVVAISAGCIVFPFALGFAIGQISAPILAPGVNPLAYSLFVATALSITAVPILGRIMAEFDLTRTHIGAITISAAAVNDVVGWLLLAVISSMSIAQFSLAATLIQISYLAMYIAVCWFVVRPILRWVILRSDSSRAKLDLNLLAIMLVVVFISSMTTYSIGIFAIFGGFVIGVLVHEHHQFVNAWKRNIGDFVLVFFLPVFFTFTGLRTDIAGLDTLTLWNWCAVIIIAATLGKFGGAFFGARIAGLNHNEANTIGVMMNTRALMELIVLNIGFDLGFIPQNVFTMLVIMAVFSTIITAPILRTLLPRMGHAVPQGIDA